MDYVLVIGALNADICGKPSGKLLIHESNIGKVTVSMGGVGHNIALNLALLGGKTRFITALGGDSYAHDAQSEAEMFGLDISDSLVCGGLPTSVYLCLCDKCGDMVAAVNDMTAIDKLTPAFLAEKTEIMKNAALIVIDCNLPEESIEFITGVAESARVPVFADTVSATKAMRLKKVIHRLHTIKPNRGEAGVLSEIEITDTLGAASAAEKLLAAGLKRVFISLGAEGAYCADRDTGESFYIKQEAFEPVNATGAGDAFMAAIAMSHLNGYNLQQTARAGLSAARQAAMSESTVNFKIKFGDLVK